VPGQEDGPPAQTFTGWRLWISATGRHWAIRCGVLSAAQVAAGARPLLWAEDHGGLVGMIGAQDKLAAHCSRLDSPLDDQVRAVRQPWGE
jgi:hypothetical protein